jgi:hypothetical protein
MQQVNTEIVYNQSRTLQPLALSNGVGRESLIIIGELIPLGRGWTFNTTVSYSMDGFGAVPVLIPEFSDGIDAPFQRVKNRSQAIACCVGSAQSLATYLDRDPALIDELWAEGRYKLFTSFGVKFAGGPDDFTS